MNFREYSCEDLQNVIRVFRSNIPKYFSPEEENDLRLYLEESPNDYFVFEIGGDVIASGGFALNNGEDPTVSLCWGMVHFDRLGTGLGRKMTEFRLGLVGERFPNTPVVISTSQLSQGFYGKFGFMLTRHVPDGFSPGLDICEMRLDR